MLLQESKETKRKTGSSKKERNKNRQGCMGKILMGSPKNLREQEGKQEARKKSAIRMARVAAVKS